LTPSTGLSGSYYEYGPAGLVCTGFTAPVNFLGPNWYSVKQASEDRGALRKELYAHIGASSTFDMLAANASQFICLVMKHCQPDALRDLMCAAFLTRTLRYCTHFLQSPLAYCICEKPTSAHPRSCHDLRSTSVPQGPQPAAFASSVRLCANAAKYAL
jgi:hypothetical protein